MSANGEARLTSMRAAIEAELSWMVTAEYPEALYDAMAYSLLAPGKRLRPLLTLAACEACGGAEDDAMPFACALEMIHAYSLIHDDLPAMDDDDLRRGRPTSHIQFGEALAILAGDALLNLAYEVMCAHCVEYEGAQYVQAMQAVALAAGAKGMVGGQVVDVLNENKRVDEDTLMYIHRNKTGALIRAALIAGSTAAGADAATCLRFGQLGEKLGLAFQIQDDILDEVSTTEALGKPVHSDAKNQKNTAVSMYGLEEAQARYAALCAAVQEMAAELSAEGSLLRVLVESMAKRLS